MMQIIVCLFTTHLSSFEDMITNRQSHSSGFQLCPCCRLPLYGWSRRCMVSVIVNFYLYCSWRYNYQKGRVWIPL